MSISAAYNVLLIDEQEMTWQSSHIVAGCSVPELSIDEINGAAEALSQLYAIDGLVSFADYALEATALLASRLGLIFNDASAVRAARDKHATRSVLADADVPSARSWLATDLREARWIAAHLGYPVVFKPRNLGGSAGVVKVSSADEIPMAYAKATDATEFGYARVDGLLVEEMLVGPEISAETATVNGQTEVVAITRKRTGFAPYFAETGHSVSADDELATVDSEPARVARAALAALNVTSGVSHVEMILTPTGPRIVEVNARLAGDLIPLLVTLACGRDLSLIAAQIAVGDEISSSVNSACAALRFYYPPRSGRLEKVELRSSAQTGPWLRRIDRLASIGSKVAVPPEGFPSRICFAAVVDADRDRCDAHLDAIESGLEIRISPN